MRLTAHAFVPVLVLLFFSNFAAHTNRKWPKHGRQSKIVYNFV